MTKLDSSKNKSNFKIKLRNNNHKFLNSSNKYSCCKKNKSNLKFILYKFQSNLNKRKSYILNYWKIKNKQIYNLKNNKLLQIFKILSQTLKLLIVQTKGNSFMIYFWKMKKNSNTDKSNQNYYTEDQSMVGIGKTSKIDVMKREEQ